MNVRQVLEHFKDWNNRDIGRVQIIYDDEDGFLRSFFLPVPHYDLQEDGLLCTPSLKEEGNEWSTASKEVLVPYEKIRNLKFSVTIRWNREGGEGLYTHAKIKSVLKDAEEKE